MSRLEDALNKAYQAGQTGVQSGEKVNVKASTRATVDHSLLAPIYTNIQLILNDVESPVVAFSSTLPKEGVSTIVYHLSQLIAREKKTLVVDFNVLSPRMHKFFQVDNIKGLSDILQGKKKLKECLAETNVPGLDLLPCGPTGAASFQILGSGVVRRIMAEIKTEYEMVLMDCPSLTVFPDSAILSALCDGVVLVVRSGKTKREVIVYAQDLLEKGGAHQLGVILNRVRHYIPGFIYRRL
jgi:capsular exopolysaccharide synthesis family protein